MSPDLTTGIYVASRASNPVRPAMWRHLRDAGWPIVSTWIDEAGEGQTECFTDLWARIEHEIRGSRGLIVYAEPDDFPLKGAYVEVGIALGAGLPVAVVMPDVELNPRSGRPMGSWIRHPRVSVCTTLNEARAVIESAASRSSDADRSSLRLTDSEREVLAERRRQVGSEGWTLERDQAANTSADLAQAAAFYAMYGLGYEAGRVTWPGDPAFCKPKDERRNYVRGAALLIAALELDAVTHTPADEMHMMNTSQQPLPLRPASGGALCSLIHLARQRRLGEFTYSVEELMTRWYDGQFHEEDEEESSTARADAHAAAMSPPSPAIPVETSTSTAASHADSSLSTHRHLSKFQRVALEYGVRNLLYRDWFDILEFERIAKLLRLDDSLNFDDCESLHLLHCVHWDKMDPEHAAQIRVKCLEMLKLPPGYLHEPSLGRGARTWFKSFVNGFTAGAAA